MKTVKRRRKENKTDYLKRLKMLKGEKPRAVFRKSNRYLISQYVESREAQDNIVMGVDTKSLIKYGWPKESVGSLKSTTASYLLGYLFGKKVIKEKLKTPIVDFGMERVLAKTKLHAFLNGLVDAGLKIGIKKDHMPKQERIQGKHLRNKIPFEEIKSKIDKQ